MIKDSSSISWMAHNRVTSNLLMLVFILGGLYMTTIIKKEVFPEYDLDTVTIAVPYNGASPEEVEQGIVLAAEDKIQDIEGIKEIASSSKEGLATITVELQDGSDRMRVYQDIKQRIDSITTFPEDAEKPTVQLNVKRSRVLTLTLMGEKDDRLLREIGEVAREKLLLHKNISQVELVGSKEYEVHVEINALTMEKYNLSLKNISDKIASQSVEISSGSIRSNAGDLMLRVKTRRYDAQNFATLPILTSTSGTIVTLGEIAKITDTFQESSNLFLFNNKPAIALEVYRVGKQTPQEVSKAVSEVINEMNSELKKPFELIINHDMSKVYDSRLELLLKNAFFGLALVLIILGLFLEFKLAFWVAMGIPTAFLGSFLFLPFFGVSINTVSMFAFIISLGIVVDDAIIVGENIYEYRKRGMGYKSAAIQATKDILIPLTFSILTNIVAFIPILFIPGMMGKTFLVIPIVVATVFAISWVEALYILPSHLSPKKETPRKGIWLYMWEKQQIIANGLNSFVEKVYKPSIIFFIKNRYATFFGGVIIFAVVVSYAMSGRIGFTMMPRVESDRAVLQVTLPVGVPLETSEKISKKILSAGLKTIQDANETDLNQGYRAKISENEVEIVFYLQESSKRIISTAQFIKQWRKNIGQLAGIDSMVFKSDIGGPGGGRPALTLELSHKDLEILDKASEELGSMLAQFSMTKDIKDGFTPGKRQITFQLLPLGEKLGLSAYEIARQVRYVAYGKESLREQYGRNEMKIIVKQEQSERISEADIDEIKIKTPDGSFVRLGDVAKKEEGNAYTTISRRDGRRVVEVTANVEPESKTPEIIASLEEEYLPKLKEKYPELQISYQGRQAETQDSMNNLKASFVLVLIVLYLMLAIPFENYSQPLIIMLAIPFGVVGAFLGHIFLGYSLSIISIMGIVALSGVVVNDTLVMIDYANRVLKDGKNHFEAIVAASTRRFRPIILTTLTTFGGLAPMIYETSIQAKFLIPMAISLGYGILFSTIISLILVPVIYMILEDFKHFFYGGKDEVQEALQEG
ncbi:MAG: efflux RND transporter permease subunit [Sulfurospirillaceae bacterium]|nr:efflux RND transporter permease subunit [Sulfurospirillaceae bacterium]